MNIIANNCVAAGIYNELNLQYKNPFMWCFISGNDFYTLIKEYDNINFNNYDIINSCLDKENPAYNNTYSLLIDNKFYVHYIHYIQNEMYNEPTKKSEITGEHSRDILYKNAKELCIENYEKRLLRMKDEPIFVISQSKYSTWEEIRHCMYLNSKYKRIILIPEKFIYDNTKVDTNCEIIIQPENGVKWVNEKAKYILSNSNLLNYKINVQK